MLCRRRRRTSMRSTRNLQSSMVWWGRRASKSLAPLIHSRCYQNPPVPSDLFRLCSYHAVSPARLQLPLMAHKEDAHMQLNRAVVSISALAVLAHIQAVQAASLEFRFTGVISGIVVNDVVVNEFNAAG